MKRGEAWRVKGEGCAIRDGMVVDFLQRGVPLTSLDVEV